MATLERGEHCVLDHEFLAYMRRECPQWADRWFTYFIPADNRWAFAEWLCRDAGEHRDLTSWDAAVGPTKDDVDQVRFNMMPHRVALGIKDWLSRTAEARRAKARWRKDHRAEAERRRKHWQNRSNIHVRDDPSWQNFY